MDLKQSYIANSTYNAISDKLENRVEFLRKYFDINNSYLLSKIALILCPFYFNGSRPDLYIPDLYIPIMSLISLILFQLAHKGKFHPEQLLLNSSRSIILTLLLSGIYKLFLIKSDISVEFLSILSFSGYKFITVFFSVVIGAVFPKFIAVIFYIYLLSALFTFVCRSLNNMKERNSIVFLIAGIEIIFSVYYIRK